MQIGPSLFETFFNSSLEQDVINGRKHAWRSCSNISYSVDIKYNSKRGLMKSIRPVAMKSEVEMPGSG